MVKTIFDYNSFYPKKNKRKPFKISTKKMEWNRSADRDVLRFASTSKCRKCHRPLKWGDRSYEFDHKNNKEWDNRLENCWLVCRICHGKATRIGKRRITGFMGTTIGYKTIKKKVGYKKVRAKKHKRKHRKKREYNQYGIKIEPIKLPKIDLGF
jgi:hypothetical protein